MGRTGHVWKSKVFSVCRRYLILFTVFPEKKESISRDTEVTIGSILDSYNERGRQFAAEGIHYSPITLLTTISNLYLIKKSQFGKKIITL